MATLTLYPVRAIIQIYYFLTVIDGFHIVTCQGFTVADIVRHKKTHEKRVGFDWVYSLISSNSRKAVKIQKQINDKYKEMFHCTTIKTTQVTLHTKLHQSGTTHLHTKLGIYILSYMHKNYATYLQ